MLLDEYYDEETTEELENMLTNILFDAKVSLKLSTDIWGPLLMQKSCELLTKLSLASTALDSNPDSGVLLKLFLHPELEVRLKSLDMYQQSIKDADKTALITKDDVLNIILCEQNESCLSILLNISLDMENDEFTLEDAAYILSLVQVKQSDDVLSSAILLTTKILSSVQKNSSSAELESIYIELGDTLKRFSSAEQPPAVREAVVQTLLNNPGLLIDVDGKSLEVKCSHVLIWSSLIDLVYDDEDEIRLLCSKVNQQLSGDLLTGDRLARSLADYCLQNIGLVWPGAAVFIILGHIISLAGDSEQEIDTENDKAFDKGEMNTYRELHTTCQNFLPLARSFMLSLSPKLLQKTAVEQLPSQLIAKLLPCLPGSVVVYSLEQLAAYVKIYSGDDTKLNNVFKQISSVLEPLENL